MFDYDGMVIGFMVTWMEMHGVRGYCLLVRALTGKAVDGSGGWNEGNVFYDNVDFMIVESMRFAVPLNARLLYMFQRSRR